MAARPVEANEAIGMAVLGAWSTLSFTPSAIIELKLTNDAVITDPDGTRVTAQSQAAYEHTGIDLEETFVTDLVQFREDYETTGLAQANKNYATAFAGHKADQAPMTCFYIRTVRNISTALAESEKTPRWDNIWGKTFDRLPAA